MVNQPGINTQGQIPDLTIRDMVRMASLNLRGSSKKIENGYQIELRNQVKNILTRVKLARSWESTDATNLTVETGKVREEEEITSAISLANIKHLYVTWETPGQVDFCFASDGRYTLVKISYDTGSFIVNSIDRRATQPPEEELSESAKKARGQRRTFYHIGTLFDRSQQFASEDEIIDEAEDVGLPKRD